MCLSLIYNYLASIQHSLYCGLDGLQLFDGIWIVKIMIYKRLQQRFSDADYHCEISTNKRRHSVSRSKLFYRARLMFVILFLFSSANKRVAVDFTQWSLEETGYPDGMTIDQEGKLWVAGYSSSKIMQFDPVTGLLRFWLFLLVCKHQVPGV